MSNVVTERKPAKAEKLRLNTEQWQILQKLANCPSDRGAETLAADRRLTSNGLVAQDQTGCSYLTIFGLHRLSQGR